MDAREFDDLIARIANSASRRSAVRGVVGGALAGVGLAAAAEAKTKGKGKARKGRRGVGSETNAHNGKRTLCLCKEASTTTGAPTTSTSTTTELVPDRRSAQRAQPRALVCETKHLKKKKARKALRRNPGSYRGPCQSTTTTSTSTSTSTTTQQPPQG